MAKSPDAMDAAGSGIDYNDDSEDYERVEALILDARALAQAALNAAQSARNS
jgi:hypothetical protein